MIAPRQTVHGRVHQLNFSLDATAVYDTVKARLRLLAGLSSLDGFRPGKVPFAVVERRLGPEVRQEAIGELVIAAFYDAAARAELRPAGPPDIRWRGGPDAGDTLEFTALFETCPEFEPVPVEGLAIRRPLPAIGEEDVDRALALLRERHKGWVAVDRPAREGDRVVVDLRGYMDEEALREIRGVPLVLGEPARGGAFGQCLQDEFARQIAGTRRGETVELDIGFPVDYECPQLAGQTARFTLHLRTVEAPLLPAADDAFAAAQGIAEGGLAALRAQLREALRREADAAARALVRQRVEEALLASHPLELPPRRVEAEVRRLRERLADRMAAEGFADADIEIAALMVQDQARRRVALGYIYAALARREGIPVPPEAEEQAIAAMAADSPPHLPRIAAAYRQYPALLGELDPSVMQEPVVDWVAGRAEMRDEPMAYGRLVGLASAAPADTSGHRGAGGL